MPVFEPQHRIHRLVGVVLGAALALAGTALHAHEPTHQHAAAAAPPPFVASTAKPFAVLMDEAMVTMDHGMRAAPMNGVPEHDFVTMMIPHHQGAIDMAKALLLTTRDPELRNLAQSIIAEQRNEIALMQAWLARHDGSATGTPAADSPAVESPAFDTAPDRVSPP